MNSEFAARLWRSSLLLATLALMSAMPQRAVGEEEKAGAENPGPQITTRVFYKDKDRAWYCELFVFNNSQELLTIQRRPQGFAVKDAKSHTIALEAYRDADGKITLLPQEGFVRRVKILDKAVAAGRYWVELDYRLKARLLGKSEAPVVEFVVPAAAGN